MKVVYTERHKLHATDQLWWAGAVPISEGQFSMKVHLQVEFSIKEG